jgi:Domain of unknown function (DUF4760)
MTLELLNTIGELGTFVVIAATAIAAIVQLRHLARSNRISVLNELRQTYESEQFQAARSFVRVKISQHLNDRSFRHQLHNPSERTDETRAAVTKMGTVANVYEGMGALVKAGMIDQRLVFELWGSAVVADWTMLAPYTAMMRVRKGRQIFEHFEYLTVLAQDWLAAHPDGTYPKGMRRIDLKDEWIETPPG